MSVTGGEVLRFEGRFRGLEGRRREWFCQTTGCGRCDGRWTCGPDESFQDGVGNGTA